MMLRVVLIFLLVVMVLAMIGKLRLPQIPRRRSGPPVEATRKCPECGTYVLASAPVPCEHCRNRGKGA